MSQKSERDMQVQLQTSEYIFGATSEGITQVFIHAFTFGEYVVKEGCDIVYVSDKYGYPDKETIFRIELSTNQS